jgi:hypothetical protein
MKTVTLTGSRPWYKMTATDGQKYEFISGVPAHVSDEVGAECAQKLNRHGEKIFEVKDFSDPDADVAEIMGVKGVQGKFAVMCG